MNLLDFKNKLIKGKELGGDVCIHKRGQPFIWYRINI